MTHAEIEKIARKFIIDSATKEANPRVQAIMLRIVTDIFKIIEDFDCTPSEVWKGVEYIHDLGFEAGLLAPGLGIDRFIDMRLDEAEKKLKMEGGTPRTIEGPLYVHGAPESVGFARMDVESNDKPEYKGNDGDILIVSGYVYGGDGSPLPNSKVEAWHADIYGNYSFFDNSQPEFNLRKTIITDENGKYSFRTIVPRGYSCPPNGNTQKLLDLLGRHGNRPAHIHFFVSAPNHRKLTTQVNFADDPYAWDDFAFATREGLMIEKKEITDKETLQKYGVEKAFESTFNFHLLAQNDKAPEDEVTRRRASV